MNKRKDPVRLALRVIVFAALFYGSGWFLFGPVLLLAGNLAGPTFAVLFSALFATWLALRIYENLPVFAMGFWWNRSSVDNLLLGLGGGAGAAVVALGPALLAGAVHVKSLHAPDAGGLVFALFCVAAGSVGEELFFRGYAFQLLAASLGPWAAVVPVGIVFGLMHSSNPNATWLGLANTAGFGILFGYGWYRSRDLWLPIGLHFGWNVTLPAFGADLSGIRIFSDITGREMAWRTGALWSGGNYGPEASVLTSLALIPLFLFLWKAPIRRQYSPFLDPPRENAKCEPSPLSPS